MQVIVITRLHAMYQRSRKMLVFLSGIFLIVQIASVVMNGVQRFSGCKLPLCISDFALQPYETNISGVQPIWYPYVPFQL
jgi:hypothetical protein